MVPKCISHLHRNWLGDIGHFFMSSFHMKWLSHGVSLFNTHMSIRENEVLLVTAFVSFHTGCGGTPSYIISVRNGSKFRTNTVDIFGTVAATGCFFNVIYFCFIICISCYTTSTTQCRGESWTYFLQNLFLNLVSCYFADWDWQTKLKLHLTVTLKWTWWTGLMLPSNVQHN